MARAAGVPVFVDAAAEILTIPNVHLQAGAALVGYSGGKYLRGPQSAGLLLGRKDLVTAAWVHSAPHFGFGRAMKVSKEEAVGLLTAVEMWTKRNHQAEWNTWLSALNTIASRVMAIDGVTTSIAERRDELEDPSPVLTVRWDKTRVGIRGAAVNAELASGEPRIVTSGASDTAAVGSISIKPHFMAPGDELAISTRLFFVLSNAPQLVPATPSPAPPDADLSGHWDVEITYAASSATHRLVLIQRGNRLQGSHQGNFVARDLTGSVSGSAVRITSAGELLDYAFTGAISANEMSGSLNLGGGGYFTATWTAKRHA
jgi:L-seryl-tRNA(Ser) seleniumtransferase